MATNFRGKLGQVGRPNIALAFGKGVLEHWNADWRVNSAVNWPTSCTNLVRFGAVTAEFTWLICVQQASISTGVR